MQSAIDNIKATYDYETCKEIVDHGCQSGVCSQHIYYGDTIKFFDSYADEVTEYIKDILGVEVLSDTLKENDGDLDAWKNDLTWTFIELVAMQVVDDVEEQELNDDKVIGNYMKEEISNYGYTASDLDGYNPAGSMTDSRYSQVWLSTPALRGRIRDSHPFCSLC